MAKKLKETKYTDRTKHIKKEHVKQIKGHQKHREKKEWKRIVWTNRNSRKEVPRKIEEIKKQLAIIKTKMK